MKPNNTIDILSFDYKSFTNDIHKKFGNNKLLNTYSIYNDINKFTNVRNGFNMQLQQQSQLKHFTFEKKDVIDDKDNESNKDLNQTDLSLDSLTKAKYELLNEFYSILNKETNEQRNRLDKIYSEYKEQSKKAKEYEIKIISQQTKQTNLQKPKQNIPISSIITNLKNAGNTYATNQSKIKSITLENKNKKTKENLDKVYTAINQMLFSISTDLDAIQSANKFNTEFKEILETKDKEFIIGSVHTLLKLLFQKVSNSSNDKDKIQLLSLFLSLLNSSTIEFLFIQEIVYSCPYIIPFEYTENDFKNEEERLRRNGRKSDEKESDFCKRMEMLSYFYFHYMKYKYYKYSQVIQAYKNEISQMKNISCAIVTSFKEFIIVFGKILASETSFDDMEILCNDVINKLLLVNKDNNIDVQTIIDVTKYKLKKLVEELRK